MSKTLVISDLHLGVQRSGGTTMRSADELREFARQKHVDLLALAPANGCKRVVVNGDLTDVYDISLTEALDLYSDTNEFLSANPDIELIWALGNHDLSKDSSRLGTVAFVGALLRMRHSTFRLISEPTQVDDLYIIPHLINQDVFDYALTQVPDGVKWLLLHCNYDNTFACAADHSLNISRDQAKEFKGRGIKLVLGHEHQGRETLGSSVIIVGNQFPTSIADCLPHGEAQRDGKKRAMVIDGDAHSFITTWTPDDADGWFARVDWRELKEVEEEGRGFIRVEGDAARDEATDVIKAIATFRQRSKSFVVTNAVRVEQAEGLEDIGDSIEDVRSLNVIDLLLEQLDEKEAAVVRALLAEKALEN